MTTCDEDPDYRAGYPLDRRRRTRGGGPIGDFELKAGRVVARHLGECVVLQDDGSQDSMVDMRIEYQDRPCGYVEVITDIDPGYAAMLDWLKKLGRTATGYQIPPVLPMPMLRHAWYLTLSGRTYEHGRTLLDELERLLGQLEGDGQLFDVIAHIEKLRTVEHESVKRLTHLGVVAVGSTPGTGSATLSPDGIVGPAEPS